MIKEIDRGIFSACVLTTPYSEEGGPPPPTPPNNLPPFPILRIIKEQRANSKELDPTSVRIT